MSIGAITPADISSADWSLEVGTIGSVVQGLADVDQCIAIILSTPRGSDVLRPTFGADLWRYIDNPITLALPAIVREASAAITLWEPRVRVVSISAATDTDSGSHLNITVTWQLKLGGNASTTRTTSVGIGER